ncbi:PREDICTED: uncharacterized protein LOC109186281 [Ipomoea nil]|uniref:uncharacterized protein LOC109186281 n=1 Tax=Ipomoea nil TaxID=35883 RepID=UPI0009010B50|nr:PREDICTED: uncharacterized protein LOC109186281 [Ipomoea nil]
MVNSEERLRALQTEIEARLEASNLEQNTRITAGQQRMEDAILELRAHMVEWKDEIMELLRLNRPPPPSMDQPSVHGHPPPPQQSPGEGSVDPGRRRPGKEPVEREQVEMEEVSDGDDGLPENPLGYQAFPGNAARPGLARRVHFGARAGQHNPGGDQGIRYKHEFPSFDYENPRLWVVRCERFFMLARVPREEILHVLCVNLTGKVALWYEGYLNGLREGFQWAVFARALCKRFCENSTDVMEEFASFKHTGNVTDFADKYEEYRGLLLQIYPYLTEQYFLDNFIVRLKQHLRCFVRTAKPASLEDAIWTARQFEKGLKTHEPQKNTSYPQKTSFTSQNTQAYPKTSNPKHPEPHRPQNIQNFPKTSASNTFQSNARSPEISKFKNQLREQNRCFRCFDPWSPGHKCKSPTFNIIEGVENLDCEEEANEEQPVSVESVIAPESETVEVTLCAVIGGEGFNTIKLMGSIGKQAITILVDSGSTHSFLDPRVLNQMKIIPEKSSPLMVTVANWNTMVCDLKCDGLKWQVQNVVFERDFRVLKLGGCDMVLGMDWIDNFAPIPLHTRPPGISFHKDGRRVLLKGMTKGVTLHSATKKEIRRWKKEGVQGFWVQSTPQLARNDGSLYYQQIDSLPSNPELAKILQDFQDLFAEPKTLPPRRPFDHEIPLMPGAKPVNFKPYRYSFVQKNTIEKMVEEMLTAGIISHSTSPFASPVLLVPKKDNTWRFCVDYRALNEITIKNKFPIPLVEDLFSELANAKVFTKLDLRAGYHQVRMKEGEEFKTAFRTHLGLYEFKVMPFGLTNAPATFQSLMNFVFKPLIRKTVLVFFDDILIYSPTLNTHWGHLREVLKTEVEYLGHIISEKGLHTDPAKLAAVASWPKPANIKELRGFLGLTGYYRRFIRAYGIISRPLANMLKKDAFQWSEESETAFETLKQALCGAPVLTLPDFEKSFVVEADACYKGMGAVLMQEGKPVAYFSKGFGTKHLGLSIYEKEYLSIINAVDKWRSYLMGRPFTIKTDHQSLKFLLEQKITTAMQQKGLTKLLGLNYTIQYKKGVDNSVADALSRRRGPGQAENLAISAVRPLWLEEVIRSYEGDELASKILTEQLIAVEEPSNFTVVDGLVRFKGRLYIGQQGDLRRRLLIQLHSSPTGGHSGQQVTYHRLKQLFYWKGMKNEVIAAV